MTRSGSYLTTGALHPSKVTWVVYKLNLLTIRLDKILQIQLDWMDQIDTSHFVGGFWEKLTWYMIMIEAWRIVIAIPCWENTSVSAALDEIQGDVLRP